MLGFFGAEDLVLNSIFRSLEGCLPCLGWLLEAPPFRIGATFHIWFLLFTIGFYLRPTWKLLSRVLTPFKNNSHHNFVWVPARSLNFRNTLRSNIDIDFFQVRYYLPTLYYLPIALFTIGYWNPLRIQINLISICTTTYGCRVTNTFYVVVFLSYQLCTLL